MGVEHFIEGAVLWTVTLLTAWFGLACLVALWYERPRIGRNDDGSPRPVRCVTKRKGTP